MKWWKRAIGFLREMNINKRERGGFSLCLCGERNDIIRYF